MPLLSVSVSQDLSSAKPEGRALLKRKMMTMLPLKTSSSNAKFLP